MQGIRLGVSKTLALSLALILMVAVVISGPAKAVAAGPQTISQTFSYTGSTSTFTVPAGISQLSVTAVGAEGGRGGPDSAGLPPAGGYQGVVSGTIAVTPGQVLTIGVGQVGASGPGGAGSSNPARYTVGAPVGGANPLGYNGGNGGVAGFQGSSGYGAGGGAASVVKIGGSTIVAGGSGGSGGSGQYSPTLGRLSYSTFSPRTDTTSAAGQNGITVATVCNNAPAPGCDGGGSGGGGGGAVGGAQGGVQFGSGTSNEWYGYGGYPGQNDTAGVSGLTSSYQFYADNATSGSVTISYVTGVPGAPTNLLGVAQDSAVALSWNPPVSTGGADISDYVVQYAPASSPTSWTTFDDGVGVATSAVVTGLTDGTAYVFAVSAVNSFGTGDPSTASASVSPSAPPSAPTISGVTPGDGSLAVAFPATASGSPILNYEYQVNGSGNWISASTVASPLQVTGLVNGTQYSVQIRAVSAIGAGAASAAALGAPQAPPGAPAITAVSTGVGTATVAFTPGYLGGGTATDYQYQLNGGAWVSAGTTVSPITISGLANGTQYTIALRASSVSGTGAASQPSTVTTPGVPAAPAITAVATGDGSLAIAFTPGNSGGTTVTGYQYQLTTNGPWIDTPSLASPILVSGLSNGTEYNLSVRAVNIIGPGAASAPHAATPATVPAAPTIIGNTVAGSNSQLSAAFTPPANNGGAAITTYQYSTDAGATWRTRDDSGTTATPLVISTLSSDGTTLLENGTTYFVELRAVNSAGAGQASAVATGIASTTPSAPVISSVTPASQSLQVTIAPAANGGAAITGYQYQLNGGSWVDTGTLSNTFVIGGLDNGTPYDVSVRAVNGQGNGAASTPVTAIPSTVPAQPSITDVTRADKTLIATVNEPSDGGAPVLSWEYSTDGGATWATANAPGSTLTITSLSSNTSTRIANGTSYPITVRAVNISGASVPSLLTTVGPSATPSAPVVTLTSGDKTIHVAYTVASNGGSPVTAVEYRLNGGTWFDAGTLASPFTIAGLVDGMHYVVEVRADNAIGAGASSIPATATPAGLPGAPTGVAAVSNTASADVSWTAPGSDGGVPLTGYTANAYASAGSTTVLKSCTTATTSCSITGLTNGTGYYVSVVATNSTGTGPESSPRVLVTPLARPAAPTLNSLTAGNALLSLAFTAGGAGDKPITGYQYQLNGGSWVSASSTSSPITLSGLTNGTSYTVALRAVSAAGVGVASSTLTATPYTFPDAPNPTFITANGTNGSAVITWQAPSNNGSAITGYTATAFSAASGGSQASTCSTSGALTCTILGLSNGTTYYISIQAQNAAGLSVRSDPRVAVTPALLPGAVSGVVAAAGNGQATVSWTPGSTGASAISDYTIWYSSGGAYTQFADGTSTSTSATVTGLTNGTAYTFKVYAVNGSGTGPASAPSNSVTPLAPGTVPTTSTPVSTVDGFTFDITNYSPTTTYTLTATNGAGVGRSGSTVTVSGLGAGASSTIGIGAALTGFTPTSSNVIGSALAAGIVPTFSTVSRTPDGYSFSITNYVPSALYTFNATNGATLNQYGANVVVTGLAAGASADVTVNIARSGYTDASAIETGSALAAGTAPALTNVTPTNDGFTFDIANYVPGLVYTYSATNGAQITPAGSTIVVSGLSPGESSDVTVTVTNPGVSIASATTSGTALLTGTVPTLSAPVSLEGGFAFAINNFSPDVSYSVSSTDGTATLNGSDVAVTGLADGASATVTVTATRDGYTATAANRTGSALPAGVVPTFSAPSATVDGFTFDITNFDPAALYTFGATGTATVTVDNEGHVTVSGLAAGESSTVTALASTDGHLSEFASLTGQALSTGITPVLSDPTSTADGFTFDITNYDPNTLYTFDSTGGGVVAIDGAGHVTVSGLAAGDSSTVTVTAVHDGSVDATDSVTGQALAAPVVTPTGSPTDSPTPSPSAAPAVGPSVTPSPSASPSSDPFGLLGGDSNSLGDPAVPSDSPSAGPAASDGSHPPTPADVVKPGQGAVTLDGVAAASKLTRTHSRLVLTSGGLSLELAAMIDGHEVMLPAGSFFTAVQGGHLYVWLKGFKAESLATIWGFSTPVMLKQLTIGANHDGAAGFTLPDSMKPGNHMLVVSGIAANGKRATMTVGLVIKAAAAAPASPALHPAAGKGSGLAWVWWVVGGALALAGLIFFLLWRRRREEDEEEHAGVVKPALPSTSAMPQQRKSDEAKPALPKHHGTIKPRQPEADRDRDRLS